MNDVRRRKVIDSTSWPLGEVLTLGPLEPAAVQRQYQWQAEHVSAMVSDLVGAFQTWGGDPGSGQTSAAANLESLGVDGDEVDDDPAAPPTDMKRWAFPGAYMLGGMIFYLRPGAKILRIYDGLQRLTTLMLLLAELRNSWPDISAADRGRLDAVLLVEGQPRLSFVMLNRVLAPIIRGTAKAPAPGGGGERLSESEKNVRRAADCIAAAFAGWSAPRRSAFLTFMLDRVYLTVSEVDNLSLAYQMFVSANDRGLKLGVSDVLKGQFAEKIRRGGGTYADVEDFSMLWRNAQLSLGRSFEPFLHAVEVLENHERVRHSSSRHQTGSYLTARFADGTRHDAIMAWFKGEFSTLLRAAARTRQHLEADTAAAQGIDISLRQLSFFGWHEWLAFYLQIARSHGDDDTTPEFAAEVQLLQKACIKFELLDTLERTRRRFFAAAIADRAVDRNPFGHGGRLAFSAQRTVTALKSRLRGPLPEFERRGTIVRWLETLHHGALLPRRMTDDTDVEHVLPVTPSDYWTLRFTVAECEQHTHRLGNLCILGQQDNWDASNQGWPEKRTIYQQRNPGTKSAGLVLDTAAAAVANNRPPWSVETIDSLTGQLARLAERELGI